MDWNRVEGNWKQAMGNFSFVCAAFRLARKVAEEQEGNQGHSSHDEQCERGQSRS